jgi:hypothetical protein
MLELWFRQFVDGSCTADRPQVSANDRHPPVPARASGVRRAEVA